jgi:hypothetical protein
MTFLNDLPGIFSLEAQLRVKPRILIPDVGPHHPRKVVEIEVKLGPLQRSLNKQQWFVCSLIFLVEMEWLPAGDLGPGPFFLWVCSHLPGGGLLKGAGSMVWRGRAPSFQHSGLLEQEQEQEVPRPSAGIRGAAGLRMCSHVVEGWEGNMSEMAGDRGGGGGWGVRGAARAGANDQRG